MPIILVVDDDQQIRAWLCHILESKGYHVEQACDGEEALTILKRLEPALIVLDLFMPNVDGFEVILHLRGGAKPVKVLAMSGNPVDGYDASRTAKLFGASETMTKPFDAATFLQHVEMLLAHS